MAPRLLFDRAQAVLHVRVDVQALDCDPSVLCWHTVLGPSGVGVLRLPLQGNSRAETYPAGRPRGGAAAGRGGCRAARCGDYQARANALWEPP